MERFTANGSHQQRPSLHTKPRHTREPHFTSHLLALAPTRDHHLRRPPDGTELSVFDANRYFKETPDQTEDRRQKKGLWRSQRGASSDPPPGSGGIAAKTSPLSNHKRRPLSTCAWPLVASCPCSRKEAVDVEEKYSTHPTCPHHLYLEGIGSGSLNKKEAKATVEETETSVFAAATGSQKVGSPTDHELGLEVEDMAKLRLVPESWIYRQDLFLGSSLLLRHEAVRFAIPFSYGKRIVATPLRTPSPRDDPTRVSLEVFQPVEEASVTPRESSDLRRRGATPLFAGDGGPRRSSSFLPASPAARLAPVEEELASDSSSDLFEIESFSTQATPSHPRGALSTGRPPWLGL